MILGLILAAVVILVDQLTKYFLHGQNFSVIGDFLWVETPSNLNTGAAFGMLSGKTIYLIIFSIPVIAFMIYLICSKRFSKSLLFKAALGLVLGGAIGNLIDRIVFKGVRDFISFKSSGFAIFNFADAFVNIGVVLLVVYFIISIINDVKKSKAEKGQLKQEGK